MKAGATWALFAAVMLTIAWSTQANVITFLGPEVPLDQVCASKVSCSDCRLDSRCGWCASKGVCAPGSVDGPSDKNYKCPLWTYGYCSLEACNVYDNCGACLQDSFCGWCLVDGAADKWTDGKPAASSFCVETSFVTNDTLKTYTTDNPACRGTVYYRPATDQRAVKDVCAAVVTDRAAQKSVALPVVINANPFTAMSVNNTNDTTPLRNGALIPPVGPAKILVLPDDNIERAVDVLTDEVQKIRSRITDPNSLENWAKLQKQVIQEKLIVQIDQNKEFQTAFKNVSNPISQMLAADVTGRPVGLPTNVSSDILKLQRPTREAAAVSSDIPLDDKDVQDIDSILLSEAEGNVVHSKQSLKEVKQDPVQVLDHTPSAPVMLEETESSHELTLEEQIAATMRDLEMLSIPSTSGLPHSQRHTHEASDDFQNFRFARKPDNIVQSVNRLASELMNMHWVPAAPAASQFGSTPRSAMNQQAPRFLEQQQQQHQQQQQQIYAQPNPYADSTSAATQEQIRLQAEHINAMNMHINSLFNADEDSVSTSDPANVNVPTKTETQKEVAKLVELPLPESVVTAEDREAHWQKLMDYAEAKLASGELNAYDPFNQKLRRFIDQRKQERRLAEEAKNRTANALKELQAQQEKDIESGAQKSNCTRNVKPTPLPTHPMWSNEVMPELLNRLEEEVNEELSDRPVLWWKQANATMRFEDIIIDDSRWEDYSDVSSDDSNANATAPSSINSTSIESSNHSSQIVINMDVADNATETSSSSSSPSFLQVSPPRRDGHTIVARSLHVSNSQSTSGSHLDQPDTISPDSDALFMREIEEALQRY